MKSEHYKELEPEQAKAAEKFRYLHFPVFILVVNTNIIVMIVIITTNSIEIPATQWRKNSGESALRLQSGGCGGTLSVVAIPCTGYMKVRSLVTGSGPSGWRFLFVLLSLYEKLISIYGDRRRWSVAA